MSIFFDQIKQQSNLMIENDIADDSIAELVLISLFTDQRASASDELPDDSHDLRGWPADSYYDSPWGSKLWLLKREKLTTDIRNLAVKYAESALSWLTDDGDNGIVAKSVTVTGSIPQFQTLALAISVVKPDDSVMSLTVSQRWENQRAV